MAKLEKLAEDQRFELQFKVPKTFVLPLDESSMLFIYTSFYGKKFPLFMTFFQMLFHLASANVLFTLIAFNTTCHNVHHSWFSVANTFTYMFTVHNFPYTSNWSWGLDLHQRPFAPQRMLFSIESRSFDLMFYLVLHRRANKQLFLSYPMSLSQSFGLVLNLGFMLIAIASLMAFFPSSVFKALAIKRSDFTNIRFNSSSRLISCQ